MAAALGAERGVRDIGKHVVVDAVVADRAISCTIIITELDATLILRSLKVAALDYIYYYILLDSGHSSPTSLGTLE